MIGTMIGVILTSLKMAAVFRMEVIISSLLYFPLSFPPAAIMATEFVCFSIEIFRLLPFAAVSTMEVGDLILAMCRLGGNKLLGQRLICEEPIMNTSRESCEKGYKLV